MHWDHDPARPPLTLSSPLPRWGEGGRRPGEGWLMERRAGQSLPPEGRLLQGSLLAAYTVGIDTRRDDPRFAQAMIEDHEAVVKADLAIRQFEVVGGASRQLRLDEVLQVVSPKAATAA